MKILCGQDDWDRKEIHEATAFERGWFDALSAVCRQWLLSICSERDRLGLIGILTFLDLCWSSPEIPASPTIRGTLGCSLFEAFSDKHVQAIALAKHATLTTWIWLAHNFQVILTCTASLCFGAAINVMLRNSVALSAALLVRKMCQCFDYRILKREAIAVRMPLVRVAFPYATSFSWTEILC